MPGWKRCAASSTGRARMAGRAWPRGSIFGHSSSATLKALTRSVALAGATGSETEEEGLERAMDESRRPGCTHHEDEGWTHASVAQGRTCGRPVERRSAGYHATAGQ